MKFKYTANLLVAIAVCFVTLTGYFVYKRFSKLANEQKNRANQFLEMYNRTK